MGGRRLARWFAVGVVAALLASALPAVASAADYCVAPNTTCGGTNVASFEQALTMAGAAADADRIFLGAATYTASGANGFRYNHPSSPVEVIGQGREQTILTSPAGGSVAVLLLFGGAGSSIHDLTIRLPQNAANGFRGLSTTSDAQRIEVVEDSTQANQRRGVELGGGGMLVDSTVAIGDSPNSTSGVLFGSGGGTLSRSVVSGSIGVASSGGGTIEQSRVTGKIAGVDATHDVTTITASLIRFTGAGGGDDGIIVISQPSTLATVNADSVTIVGPGLPNTFGAEVDNFVFPAESTELNLTNSIIRGVSSALFALAPGTGQAKLTASYSDYDPSGNSTTGANASITETNDSNVGDAGFVDAASGDYHLSPSSPLIDTGDPTTAQGLDLDGNPLVTDGNGDGIARRDKGAFELQPTSSSGGQPPAGGEPPSGGQQPAGGQPPASGAPPVSGGCQDPTGAYNQGVNAGFSSGLNKGFNSGFNDGFHAGFQSGFTRGFGSRTRHGAVSAASGEPAVRAQAIPSECNPQFNQGFNTAFNVGFNSGFQRGFNSGFASGFTPGFKDGYRARQHRAGHHR
jgi:hypothetical protein